MYDVSTGYVCERKYKAQYGVCHEAVAIALRSFLDDLNEIERQKPLCLSEASWGFSESKLRNLQQRPIDHLETNLRLKRIYDRHGI